MVDHRIREIENVDSLTGTTFMVHLARGFRLEDAHTFGADSRAAIRRTMKRVRVCACAQCTGGKR